MTKQNNILIHDQSGIYMRLILSKFPYSDALVFTNKLDQMHEIDFNEFSLIITFINNYDDLGDFAFLNGKNINQLVCCGDSAIFKKLLMFPEIDLINLSLPKNDLCKLLEFHINKTINPEQIKFSS